MVCDQKIFIVGPHRSGTSALYQLLNLSPKVFLFYELDLYRGWGDHEYLANRYGDLNGEWTEPEYRDQSLFDEVIANKWTGEDLAEHLFLRYPIVGDKCPIFHRGFFENRASALEDVRFIFALRDGRASIASRYRNQDEVWTRDAIEEAEELWLMESREIRKLVKYCEVTSSDYFIVRYEHYVFNSVGLVQDLSLFLNTPLSIPPEKAVETYTPQNVNTWEEEIGDYDFSPEVQEYEEWMRIKD